MIHRLAAVVATSIRVSTCLYEDAGTFHMAIQNSHVQRSLSLDINQVHLSSLLEQVVCAVSVARSGSNAQGSARQPATAPDRLLVDSPEAQKSLYEQFTPISLCLQCHSDKPPHTHAHTGMDCTRINTPLDMICKSPNHNPCT